MRHLRQLHLAQFSFTDEAFEKGVGLCGSLVVLHLDSQQVCVCVGGGGGLWLAVVHCIQTCTVADV
jgi:hypothetical protein